MNGNIANVTCRKDHLKNLKVSSCYSLKRRETFIVIAQVHRAEAQFLKAQEAAHAQPPDSFFLIMLLSAK